MFARVAGPRTPLLLLALAVLGAGCGGAGGRPSIPSPRDDDPFDPPPRAEVRLDTDRAGAALSIFPEICADAGHLYVVWYDRRDGDTDIRFNASHDGGATWGRRDVRLDTDPPGSSGSNVPRIACAGDRVYVVWSDQRETPSQVRFNRSLDGGATWLDRDVRLDADDPAPGSSREVVVCADGPRVYVAWEDTRHGLPDVYFNRSLDAGDTWLRREVRLNTDGEGTSVATRPRIACEGERVIVVWQDDRDGAFDVRLNRSPDAGTTWASRDVRLDTDGPGEASSLAPALVASRGRVYATWQDDRDGAFDVRFTRSLDEGATWLSRDVRLDTDLPGGADSARPALAALGPEVFVVWEESRAGRRDVHLNRSLDAGATWLDEDVRLDRDGAGVATSFGPQVAAGPAHVFVTWYDDRAGAFDVLLSRSEDRGRTWLEKEVRLDTDPPGAAHSLAPRLVADGAAAWVAWYDERDGAGDVYANRGP